MTRLLVPATDRLIFWSGLVLVVLLFIGLGRANIAADSVDYYGMLQWITPEAEKPIVRNLYFAQQRSPGYSFTAVIPYFLLTIVVEPWVVTNQVVEYPSVHFLPGAKPPPEPWGERPPRQPPGAKLSPPHPKGSEFFLIPPRPLLLWEVPFHDFFVPHEGSWFQWKLVLALAITSLLFLVAGLVGCAATLRYRFPERPGYALVILAIVCSPFFLVNIVTAPLYATWTAFGISSLFLLAFLTAWERRNRAAILTAGVLLGYLVLVRLEVAVFAGVLGLVLVAQKEWRLLLGLMVGASWAGIAWIVYNFWVFGKLVNLAILKGDINQLAFRPGYVFDGLVHPLSGVIFWTPFLVPGLVGLFLSKSRPLRLLAVASIALVILYLLRVPIMYDHVGGPPIVIGGIPVTPPPTPGAMRDLIRADNNRYLIMLLPFLILGVRELLEVLRTGRHLAPTAN